MLFELPKLPYDYNQLEPYIDKMTMEVHHKKHHQGYTTKLNEALEALGSREDCIITISKNISKYPVSVRNNGGGYYNHSLFWTILAPNGKEGGGNPSKDFVNILEKKFGSFENFKKEFSKTAANHFGSGWAWLVVDVNKNLFICSTSNQDNPLMDIPENIGKRGIPILALDVWEHAYYLNYQNKRPDYINAFWHIVNWKEVEKRYKKALKEKF